MVSVFNWIPLNLQAAILDGTSTSDLTTYLQTAFNQIGCRTLCFESSPTAGVTARYNVSAPLVNSNNDLTIIGGTRVSLRAIADLDTNNDGRGAIIYSPGFRFRAQQLTLDLNSKNGNGVFLDRCNFPYFDRVSGANTKAGYAGFRGGSILYLFANASGSSGAGRVWDLQKGWELSSTPSYYGANDSLLIGCKGFSSECWRLCGDITLIRCGEESAVNQPALRNETNGPHAAGFVLGEEISAAPTSTIVTFYTGYEEMSSGGSAALLEGILTVDGTSVVHIHSGQYSGQTASLVDSTFLHMSDFATSTIEANPNLTSWYNAFQGLYSGASTDYILTQLAMAGVDGSVTNIFKTGTGVQPGEVSRGVGNYGDISLQPTGLQIAKPIFGIVAGVTPNNTPGDNTHKINLGQARSFLIGGNFVASPIDLTYLLNIGKNQQFTFEFSSNTVRLANSAFNLLGGADKTYAIGNILVFQVGNDGVIRQIAGNA